VKVIERLKAKAKGLKKEITALYYAYKNPRLGILPKLLIILTLGYALSPIDLIPDFIPIIGYLDDLIIVPALIALSLKLIPKEIIEEARIKAEQKPLSLKKKPLVAVLFILIWVLVLGVVVFNIVKLFSDSH
jgi:uncharacterized membrane protein YkvA (DUF1232 family)